MRDMIKRNEDLFRVLAAFVAAQACTVLLMLLLSGSGEGFVFNITLNIICTLGVNMSCYLLICGRIDLPKKSGNYSRFEPFAFFFMTVFLACMAGMIAQLIPSSEDSGGVSPVGWEYLLYFMYSVILAPVAEEIAFRGAALSVLSRRGQNTAALISALLFAAYHMNLSQVPYTLVLGFFLAVLAQRSGSIIPCILIHVANNLLTLAVGFSDILSRAVNIALPVLGIAGLAWLILTGRLFGAQKTTDE